VPRPDSTPTPLARVVRTLGLKVTRLAAQASAIAAELGVPGITRQYLNRLLMDRASPTVEKIYIIVAAIREESGLPVGAKDLFDVEPPLPEGAIGTFLSLLISGGLPAHGGNVSVPIFSGGYTSPLWRVFVSDDRGPAVVDSFERLYREHGVLLRKIAIRRYSVPPGDAEALVHDTFVLYMQRHTIVREPKAWLVAAMANECKHYWRDRKREEPLLPEHDETADPAADKELEKWMRQNALAAVFARLGARCREMLQRYYLGDETKEALADDMSAKPGRIRQLVMLCRRRARELFDKATGRKK
jgi:RNA polymerase sigma factor (sigma-70 family)